MRITKEKVLFAVCLLVALLVLLDARAPRVEPVPEVPAEEGARPYRTIAAGPRLAPETPFGADSSRDPFRSRDPWERAAPATLAMPPPAAWPRALPGGPAPVPSSPHDRRRAASLPKLTLSPQGSGAEDAGGPQ